MNDNSGKKRFPVIKEREKTKYENYWRWPVKIFFLAVALSLFFGILSEHFMSNAGVVLAIIIVFIFIFISVVTDMIGVAVVACEETPLKELALKRVRGAREGQYIVKNAAKIATLCADVIGDVCGVLSGAAGATILAFIIADNSLSAYQIIIAGLISAMIAGFTIGGKAVLKQYATNNATKIVLIMGKILSVFFKNR